MLESGTAFEQPESDLHDQPLLRRPFTNMGIDEEVIRASNSHNTYIKTTMNTFSTPPVTTPPRSVTPPLEHRRSEHKSKELDGIRNGRLSGSSSVNLIDADALKNALKDYEEAGRPRDVTPGGSPSRKRQRIYGDR